MGKAEEIIRLERACCPPTYEPMPVVLRQAKGCWAWDTEGKKYLDMSSAFSAVSHGHSHPKLVSVLKKQAELLSLTSRAFHTEYLGLLCEKICDLTGQDLCITMNTGAEAVETAIKAIRRWAYRVKMVPADQAEIIVAAGNFHGRTTTVISFTSEEKYKKDFGPFTPGFKITPFGDAKEVERAITSNTCAVLVEPIQGERGIIVPPHAYFKNLADICKKHRILLILDEIQSGLGRTGKMFGFQHEGIRPDGIILGKALGGGLYPVSAFAARREVLEVLDLGSHGSTFSGNPLGSKIALTALELLEEEGLIENAEHMGNYLIKELKKICKDSPLVREIRGRGLWVALDLHKHLLPARKFCEKLLEKGVLTKDTHGTVIRLSPPLTITKEEIDFALEQIKETLQYFENKKGGSNAA
ncbi:MAG: ornithine--oxo-acid transaminase [Simkaniaceae bacterium]